MLTILLLALAVHSAAGPDPVLLKGRCTYPSTLAAPQPGELRIFCDTLAITVAEAPDERLLLFSRASTGATFGFAGKLIGDTMTVSRMHLTPVGSAAATGTCRIDRKRADISAVSCIGRIGSRTYLAGFISAG